MTAIELKLRIANGEKFNIFDVRQKERFDIFHLDGALNIEKGMLLEKAESYMNRCDTYYITCNGGNSAGMIAKMLQTLGFKVISLEGGMNPVMPH